MRMTILLRCLILCLVIAGCSDRDVNRESEVLARVGDQVLTLEQALSEIPKSVLQQDTLQAMENYQSSWIDRQILLQEALRIGLDENPELQRRFERLRSQLLENALREMLFSQSDADTDVTREEAQAYYETHKDRFVLNERHVKFRHLTTRTRTDAENARQALLRGISWPDVTEQYSINPGLQLRQSEHFFPVSMAAADIPVMNQYMDRIGIMEITPIHQHGNGFHFVQLTERMEEGDHPDLDWLISQIVEWLKMEKKQRLFNSYIRNLYLQADANNEIEQVNVREVPTLTPSVTEIESN
ncbi:MAG: peptidyl-prolyl cis-trans isomerase [Balneolaceae bacterium]